MSRRHRDRTGPGGPVRLGDALHRVLRDLGHDGPIRRQRALDVWAEAVGPALAAHSRAVGWRGAVLVVEVDDPAWAQQMSMMQEALRAAVNSRLDEPVVAGLHFRVRGGRGEGAPGGGSARRGRRARPWDSPTSADGGAPAQVTAQPRAPAGTGDAGAGAAQAPRPPDVPAGYRRWLDEAARCRDEDLRGAMTRWLAALLLRRGGERAGRCPSCGAPTAPAGPDAPRQECPACQAEWRPGGRRRRVQALLEEEPWLSAEAVAARLPGCSPRTYADVRGKLLQAWQAELQDVLERLERGGRRRDRAALRRRGSVLALRLACLVTGVPPGRLSDEAVARVLGPRAQSLLGDGSDDHLPAAGR